MSEYIEKLFLLIDLSPLICFSGSLSELSMISIHYISTIKYKDRNDNYRKFMLAYSFYRYICSSIIYKRNFDGLSILQKHKDYMYLCENELFCSYPLTFAFQQYDENERFLCILLNLQIEKFEDPLNSSLEIIIEHILDNYSL